MFQPVIPLSGNSGWKFLEATYDRQLKSYTDAPQVQLDRDYLIEKFSQPVAVEDFLKDTRLLRVSLTAYDLGGEEWKRGFIDKVLSEVSDPESTFLTRLNNPKYTAFANAMKPVDGKITLSPAAVSAMATEYEAAAFEAAVGEVDDNMRISLNYKSEIGGIVGSSSSESAKIYRMLANVPVRTLLEGAMNLPSDIRKLPIERQAEIFQERLQSTFGINKMSELDSPEIIDKAIQRFHVMESIKEGVANYSSASAALTLLGNGLGSQSSQNLFLSLL
ncbi:MAG: DUF1217 domain-containing protein [Alphaproteobacteria bacterium]|nr:DUF1217 domain-containing protein [Alphaproteobacteria bacterium]MBU2085444.1 DUF1217 domain-containing protein [Alphaproteobacteria bacterium]MBU2143488.1 DUF1217 domain-containing protein [Alphaproteobacteria bacterium]MBU2196135.1 DUF1217 domain-containing protein [Alphaproteobacteria bacterium]